jgi:hypothetical protein
MKQIYHKILILSAIISLACTTKVSEWVLLNSELTGYTLIYFHNGQLSENQKQQNTEIEKNLIGANIRLRSISKNDNTQPYFGLYYKNRLFTKYSDPVELKNLTSSPLREKIAKEIMSGRLCVMLFLKTGIVEKDENRYKILKQTIDSSPFGKIITIVELQRNDMSENHFISMLLNVESDLKSINEPMLFGIFGKLRALEPLVSKGITDENINLMISFLTADCSCLIKDDLPGTDILCRNNWENPATALVNKILDENPLLVHK